MTVREMTSEIISSNDTFKIFMDIFFLLITQYPW